MRGTFCGTPLYVSPELLKRKSYNNKIDVWSVGILTYELLFGRVPFDIATEQDFMKIVEDEIKFSKATKVSDEAKDFILICLEKDPRDRFTLP
jgi:aurora kinase